LPFGCIPFASERRHLGYIKNLRMAAKGDYVGI
jgi:hypothetical protein